MYAYEYLEKAKSALLQYGWIKGSMGSTKTGFCSMGAIGHACSNLHEISNCIIGLLHEQLHKAHQINSDKISGVAAWNDNRDIKLDQVLAMFDMAIAAHKSKSKQEHVKEDQSVQYIAKRCVPDLIEV